jgi:hypothetical protein
MPVRPGGHFPVPKVARGKGSGGRSRGASTERNYPGVRSTKAENDRPVPTVARASLPRVAGGQGGGRVPVRPTPMKRSRGNGSTAHRNGR